MEAFYDRKRETKKILKTLENESTENKILLLAGKTGVGKSGLTQKILESLRNKNSICVRISKSSPETIDNMHYINAIYRTFNKLAQENFFDDIPTPWQHGAKSLKNIIRWGVNIFLSKTIGEENKLYEPIEEGSVLHKRDYIVSLLKSRNFIISIENIQNIDTQSLEVFRDILDKVEQTVFIGEYTLDAEHSLDQFLSFYNELCCYNGEVNPFIIEQLPFDEAKKLAPTGIDSEVLMHIYQHSEGNLLKMMLCDYTTGAEDNPIQVKISKLKKEDLFLLNLLFLNDGEIEKSLLFQILIETPIISPLHSEELEECCHYLNAEKVINFTTDGKIQIAHDSIINELEHQSANPVLFVAYSILKEYYMKQIKVFPEEHIVERLFSLFVRFGDEELIKIFPYVKQIVKSRKYPQAIIYKLVRFRDILSERGIANPQFVNEIATLLTSLCLELELGEEAQNNLDLIYSDQNPYHRAMQAAIYSLDFTNKSSMNKIKKLIERAETSREKLVIQLCLLSGEMACLNIEKSKDIAKRLIDIKEYKNIFEYAFLLRNYAELSSTYDESLFLYSESIKRFRYVGRIDLCAQVYVSMSMIYAYKGNLFIAEKLLDKAKKMGGAFSRHLLNNYAVLEILSFQTNHNTSQKLEDALLLTKDPYESLIIESNLLVCYVLLNNKDKANQMRKSIEQQNYMQFQYEEFLHIVLQDLHFYYTSFGKKQKVAEIKNELQKLIEKAAPDSMVKEIGPLQLSKTKNPLQFYSNYPYRVDFLGNWNFEINRDLETN